MDNLPRGNNTRTIMGHVLKTAWVLGRIHQLFPDVSCVQAAESLAQNVLQRGYDHQLGGPYKDYDRLSGAMMMYGQDTAKAWWQMEQAFTAGMLLYEITGKDQYLQMADETVDFFMKYFVDHTYGEVFSDRTRKGAGIPAWGNDKGNAGRGIPLDGVRLLRLSLRKALCDARACDAALHVHRRHDRQDIQDEPARTGSGKIPYRSGPVERRAVCRL